jgi:hypothetical protein
LEFVDIQPWESAPEMDQPQEHLRRLDPVEAETIAHTMHILRSSEMPLAR